MTKKRAVARFWFEGNAFSPLASPASAIRTSSTPPVRERARRVSGGFRGGVELCREPQHSVAIEDTFDKPRGGRAGRLAPLRPAIDPVLRTLLAVALLAAAVAHANVRMEQVHPGRAAANATERAILFSGGDRQTIDQYFRRHAAQGTENSGKTRKDPLLIRDRLPERLATRPLPSALDRELPPLPSGYARLIVGRDVLLVERRSRTIVDIMREVVR
jgi:hypothetical protein